jgi:hypothetical protein
MYEVPDGRRRHARPVAFEQAHARLKKTWKPLVVRVEEGDKFTLRLREPTVARRARPRVLLRDETHTRVFVCAHDFSAAVCRAVVNDYDLEVSERLRRDGAERAPDVRRFVVERDDDGYEHESALTSLVRR